MIIGQEHKTWVVTCYPCDIKAEIPIKRISTENSKVDFFVDDIFICTQCGSHCVKELKEK